MRPGLHKVEGDRKQRITIMKQYEGKGLKIDYVVIFECGFDRSYISSVVARTTL